MTPEIRELQARVQRLEADLMRRPILIPSVAGDNVTYLTLMGGQTLITLAGNNYYGIKPGTAAVTSLPAILPTPGTIYADGIGIASIINADGSTGTTAWIISDYLTSPGIALPQGHVAISLKTVRLPYPNDSSTTMATAYIIWR